ncbi:hypothetical protein I3271_00865 [Photobacterium leiognathi]|uniref:hypothetical protein n=1 Tax=Photobacterium leiognathi TaxID=553611 RepID=UPI001EDCB006|nr:hypothetical protein [Photobacterium leiognathi]MCG3883233.1 hypothetical protein [Photobacterium leiognathi]
MSVFFCEQIKTQNATSAIEIVREKICDQADICYSHDIGGGLGQKINKEIIPINRTVFDTDESAKQWLKSHVTTEGPVLLVPVKAPDNYATIEISKIHDNFNKKVLAAEAEHNNHHKSLMALQTKAFQSLKRSKSKLKSCHKCTSKIAIEFVKTPHCPVCQQQNALLSNSVFNNINIQKNKLETVKTNLDSIINERDKMVAELTMKSQSGYINWIFAALCES